MRIFKIFKGSGLLNILGMAAAFASLYILLVQVSYDFGYNKSIKDAERIFMIATNSVETTGNLQPWLCRPLAEELGEQIPLVEEYATVEPDVLLDDWRKIYVGEGDEQRAYDFRYAHISESALKLFGFEPVAGTFENIGSEDKVLVSSSVAEQIGVGVGDFIALGKDEKPKEIAAIFKDMPKNSLLGGYKVLYCKYYKTSGLDNFGEWGFVNYVKLHSPDDKEEFERLAWEVSQRVVGPMIGYNEGDELSQEDKNQLEQMINMSKVTLVPLKDLYFCENLDKTPGDSGSKSTTWLFLSIAILIVGITLINFVNFFMSQVPIRMKSVSTKKIIGSTRGKLIGEFILESGILVVISLLFSVCAVEVFKGTQLAGFISSPIDFGENIGVVIATLLLAVVMTLAASIYPALYITSFPPAMTLKGVGGLQQTGKNLRYSLIAFQFILSMTFLIVTFFVQRQYNFLMNYEMGFNKELLFTAEISEDLAVNRREEVKSAILNSKYVKDVSSADGDFLSPRKMLWLRSNEDGTNSHFDVYPVSWNFLDFMGIKVIEGRDFVKSDEQGDGAFLIMNETAKNKCNAKIGDNIYGPTDKDLVVGFCEDFKSRSLVYNVTPFAFIVYSMPTWRPHNRIYFRAVEGVNVAEMFAEIKGIISSFNPEYTPDKIDVDFFDAELALQYKREQQVAQIIALFTLVAILISLMGVLGTVLFETRYRRKEIGVRRVHGATIGSVIEMFNVRFLKILGICFLVAAPVSYFIVDYYYSTFAYSSPVHLWVFLAALVVVAAIIVAVVTASCYWAATENPVESLKSE